MFKALKILAFILVGFVLLYFLGPKATIPNLDGKATVKSLNLTIEELDGYVLNKEAGIPNLKTGNEAKIIWNAPDLKAQTPYSIVYLHGFSASHEEGNPVHKAVAERYGANLYLARLEGHGQAVSEPLLDLRPEDLLASAKEAIAIGQVLGEKVIVMGCSTGATLGLFLAAENPSIASVIAYSPNIDFYDTNSEVFLQPWGLYLTRLALGDKYREFEASDTIKKYWVNRYRIEALITLKTLIKATMRKEVFQKIQQPVFMGYYYKNEEEQDKTISIPKILQAYEWLGTPAHLKRKMTFPNAEAHVICSKYWSSDLETVTQESFRFMEEILEIEPVSN